MTPNESSFYINGELYNKMPYGTLFTCDKNLDIGSYGFQRSEVFLGPIYYVQIFDEPIDKAKI